MPAIAFSRLIGPVPIDCVITENPVSELLMTEIPIETGSKITDHAVVMPKRVSLDIATANATASYGALVAFQESRVPFTLVTGLAIFRNMLIKRIDPERDASFSTILRCRVELQEAILVGTAYAADPDGDNYEQGKAGGEKSLKSAAPAPERSRDPVTADRSTGTVQRGDAGVVTVPSSVPLLSSFFG